MKGLRCDQPDLVINLPDGRPRHFHLELLKFELFEQQLSPHQPHRDPIDESTLRRRTFKGSTDNSFSLIGEASVCGSSRVACLVRAGKTRHGSALNILARLKVVPTRVSMALYMMTFGHGTVL